MTTAYSTAYVPRAPVLSVELAFPDESPRVGPLAALVDTGSDGSLVPMAYLEELEASVAYSARVRLIFGPPRTVNVYTVDLIIGSLRIPAVEVMGDDEGVEIMLGRNVLNRLILLLNGPHAMTDVLERPPKL